MWADFRIFFINDFSCFNTMSRVGEKAVKKRVTGLLKGSKLYRDTGFRMIIRDK